MKYFCILKIIANTHADNLPVIYSLLENNENGKIVIIDYHINTITIKVMSKCGKRRSSSIRRIIRTFSLLRKMRVISNVDMVTYKKF